MAKLTKKISVAVICGGRSAEHHISMQSAKNIVAALDPGKYIVSVLYVSMQGDWFYIDEPTVFLSSTDSSAYTSDSKRAGFLFAADSALYLIDKPSQKISIDCFFPMIHGTGGEDGCIQGLIELLGKAYVGCNVAASAIGMDKTFTRTLLEANGIPVLPSILLQPSAMQDAALMDEVLNHFRHDLIVKPNSLGSSIGIKRVTKKSDFLPALQAAFAYDSHVMVQRFIKAREFECAVLGSDNEIQSTYPAEITLQKDYPFYSFDAKYRDPDSIAVNLWPQMDGDFISQMRIFAEAAFQCLRCEGMLRVDFLVDENNKIFVSEVNTIPGFTKISLYPQMWQAQGMSYSKLLDKLIEIAIQSRDKKAQLKRAYE